MAVCLVTGGAGFLGSHLVEALAGLGHTVRVLDDLSTGDLAHLAPSLGRFRLTIADVTDADAVAAACDGADLVFHLAALVPRKTLGPHAADPYDAGTLQLLAAARQTRVRRIVYASTLCVYGHAAGRPRTERDPPLPQTGYARAKLCGEHDCRFFSDLYGLETVRLRFANVFGPRQSAAQPYARLVPALIAGMLAGRPAPLPGDGRRPLDLVHVGDAVQGLLLAAEAADRRVGGQVYNIGSGAAVTPLELFAKLQALTGHGGPPELAGAPAASEFDNLVDISRAAAELGYRPAADLGAELACSVERYRRDGAHRPNGRGPHAAIRRWK